MLHLEPRAPSRIGALLDALDTIIFDCDGTRPVA